MIQTFTRHGAFDSMTRHRHSDAYVALVLVGGYVETGDRGRVHIEAGQAIFHDRFEAHSNKFCSGGARVLNLPLKGCGPVQAHGEVADADLIVRMAERDPEQASELLRATFRPCAAQLSDWPDALAAALASDPALDLATWADTVGIAPQSLSRGFRRAYGVTPKRYRLEMRTLQAIRRLQGWNGSMATLAAESGFADQGHMTRSIVALTGVAPTRLMG